MFFRSTMIRATVLLYSLAVLGVCFAGEVVVKEDEYYLQWEIIDDNITVTATVKTLGFIGFGISPYGTMMEADCIFSGRYSNGTGYIMDRYAFADSGPMHDQIQNVVLLSATENATHTTVTWTRNLDTGDVAQDVPIRNETQYIIWSWGSTDTFYYHGPNRGTLSINLFEN